MYIDIGKLGLIVFLIVGAYFGINPWWVPAVMLSWLYSLFIRIPFIGTKRRAAALEAYRKQYLENVMGRDVPAIKPEDLN